MPKTSGSRLTVPFELPSAANRGALISATGLHRLSDYYVGTLGTGNGAADQQQAALGVDSHDFQVEHRHLLVAPPASPPVSPEHPGRSGAGADGAGGPMRLVGTVRSALTGEVVPLHHTGKALPLRRAGHVHPTSGLEHLFDLDFLAELEHRGIGEPDL